MVYEDYEEDYESTQEEFEEMEGQNSTKTTFKGEKISIVFDTTNFAQGIINEVRNEVKKNLYCEIVDEIKKEVLDGNMKDKINVATHKIIKEMIDDYIQNEKITVGGNFWDDEPAQEYTMKEYAKKCIRECIENQEMKVVTGVDNRRSGNNIITTTLKFAEYIRSEMGIGNEAKAYFDAQISEVKKQINVDIKNAFDESTKTMLSEAVLNVLMANETYRKIESNISCIADRKGD